MNDGTRDLFFDLDGTLTDPAPGIVACYQHVLRVLCPQTAESDASMMRLIGPPLRASLADLLQTQDAGRIDRAVAVYRERFATVGLYENSVYAGVPELLSELTAAGFRLWIVTSKARVYAEEIARHFGFLAHFAGIYGAELSGERSDKGELIGYLLQREHIGPSAAVMIGDRLHDIVGARAHGLSALGVLWGYGSREELMAAGAHAVVETLADLPRAIDALALDQSS